MRPTAVAGIVASVLVVAVCLSGCTSGVQATATDVVEQTPVAVTPAGPQPVELVMGHRDFIKQSKVPEGIPERGVAGGWLDEDISFTAVVRGLCGEKPSTIEAVAPDRVILTFAYPDEDGPAACSASYAPTSFDVYLPEGATGRPLTVSVERPFDAEAPAPTFVLE